jgi:hypothetical protein
MLDQARHLAERLVKDVPEGDAARIERAYQLLYGRKPSDEELTIAQTIIAGDDPALPNCGWVDLAHVLLCSNEMIYTD